ncbi:MAG: hypothetical protein SOZ52_09540 [Pyramidobacter sp.]|nr:hypothetical protein [Pyramidobacter sp.]
MNDEICNAEIQIYGDMGRFVIIKTPFDFSLSSEEAAEILREFWERTIIPIQAGLQRSSRITSREFVTLQDPQANQERN